MIFNNQVLIMSNRKQNKEQIQAEQIVPDNQEIEKKQNKEQIQELNDYIVCVKKINVSDCNVMVSNSQTKTLSELPQVFLIKKSIFEKPENTILKNRIEIIKSTNIAIF